ncbi:hypothetical protein ACTU6U_09730 [Microbacterium sp. A196]|uniref:hypothetical protein n=1 Tax=Microbacterium sp. A196 TaxID=3457320 RepID=UPI003FD1ED78
MVFAGGFVERAATVLTAAVVVVFFEAAVVFFAGGVVFFAAVVFVAGFAFFSSVLAAFATGFAAAGFFTAGVFTAGFFTAGFFAALGFADEVSRVAFASERALNAESGRSAASSKEAVTPLRYQRHPNFLGLDDTIVMDSRVFV